MTQQDRCGRLVKAATAALLAYAAGDLDVPAIAAPLTYEMVTVGDAGNTADTTGYGAVGYEYRIGKYEVTLGQYTTFLNAVAKTDPYGLYDTLMATALNSAGIERSGSSGSYVYSVIGPYGATPTGANSPNNRPMTCVTWRNAARFANWMANGLPTGTEDSTTTETGAYSLNGATSGSAPTKNAINPLTGKPPKYWIPTENEWYKAAYSKGGTSVGYWTYATQSDNLPGNTIGSGANQVNYYSYTTGYTVTHSHYTNGQNYLTDVGAFPSSVSAYGTFDQTGGAWEWNDLSGLPGTVRGLRGGYWDSDYVFQASSARAEQSLTFLSYAVGFRLAGIAHSAVPEIGPEGFGSMLTLIGGFLGLLELRRAKRGARVAPIC